MTTHPRSHALALAVGLAAILTLVAWAVLHAPPAHADSGTIKEAAKMYVIPASSTAILRWTFEKAPATTTVARFQISTDKRHWRTLSSPTVKASQKVVHTRWTAPSHAERRFFRLVTKAVRSDLVGIRVK